MKVKKLVLTAVMTALSVVLNELLVISIPPTASPLMRLSLGVIPIFVIAYYCGIFYAIVAGTLTDTKLEVAGDGFVILSAQNEVIVDKIYNNFRLCQELLNKIFGSEYIFVVITQEEWNIYRDEYISNIKAGKRYQLKKMIPDRIEESNSKKEATIVDKLFDLVGEDIVEFK